MSIATEEKTGSSFMRTLSTGKGMKPRTATNSQAAARTAQPAEPPATVQPTATTQQTAPASTASTTMQSQTPSVTTAPLTTPEVPPVATTPSATMTTQTTPLTQSNTVDVQPQAAPPVPESQRRVIKVDSDETLIQFPGEQPKTRAQINFERKLGQDLDRQRTELLNRERQLEERERSLRAQTSQPTQSIAIGGAGFNAPLTQPATQPVVAQPTPMPMPPKDAIEGDPEYARYQAELMQWSLKNVLPEVMKPILDFTESQKQAQANQQAVQAQRQANFQHNAQMLEMLPQYLPFDVHALPDDVQNEVFRKIVETGLKEGVNLADKELQHQQQFDPYFIKYVTAATFPAGSLPPGYRYEEIPTPALDALPPPGTPLVTKAPPSPPLQAGAPGISAPAAATTAPGRKQSFYQKLGQARD